AAPVPEGGDNIDDTIVTSALAGLGNRTHPPPGQPGPQFAPGSVTQAFRESQPQPAPHQGHPAETDAPTAHYPSPGQVHPSYQPPARTQLHPYPGAAGPHGAPAVVPGQVPAPHQEAPRRRELRES